MSYSCLLFFFFLNQDLAWVTDAPPARFRGNISWTKLDWLTLCNGCGAGKSPVEGGKCFLVGVRVWFCSGLGAVKKERRFCDFLSVFLETGIQSRDGKRSAVFVVWTLFLFLFVLTITERSGFCLAPAWSQSHLICGVVWVVYVQFESSGASLLVGSFSEFTPYWVVTLSLFC